MHPASAAERRPRPALGWYAEGLAAAIPRALAASGPDPLAQRIVLGYAALQLLLSYAVAGTAKAISPTWRSGRAVPAILSTNNFGFPSVGAYLTARPRVGRLLCWATILFECSAPFLILFGTPGAVAVIVAGLGFHISIALLMGLNVFPWSFAATYPALLLLAQTTDRLWQ